MDVAPNIILAATPEFIDAAAQTGCALAYMIYRIGRGYHLYRAQGAAHNKKGYMVVNTNGYTGGGPSSTLVSEILGECQKNGYDGIVMDTGGRATPQIISLIARLAAGGVDRGLKLFVPEVLSGASPHAVVLLPTALSGGTLNDHIGEALHKYGPGRVALEIERVRMDFSLPAVTGTGKELTEGELQALIDRHHPQSFLSKELCAYYFTYRDKKGMRFVLYDNAASIRRKLSIASQLGIENAFLFYPHVADIIDKILGG